MHLSWAYDEFLYDWPPDCLDLSGRYSWPGKAELHRAAHHVGIGDDRNFFNIFQGRIGESRYDEKPIVRQLDAPEVGEEMFLVVLEVLNNFAYVVTAFCKDISWVIFVVGS